MTQHVEMHSELHSGSHSGARGRPAQLLGSVLLEVVLDPPLQQELLSTEQTAVRLGSALQAAAACLAVMREPKVHAQHLQQQACLFQETL